MIRLLFFVNICLCFSFYGQTLSSPESIEWDQANNRWLIGNTGNGTILTRSEAGVLGNFVSGIPSGPYGIEILGNVVYACSGSTIRGYNLTTGASVFSLNVGATFLNGLTSDGTSYLYATDFSAKRIIRVDVAAGTFTNLATALAKTPNGIYYDGPNNRCVYVTWGSNASIMTIDLATNNVTTLLNTTLGNIDGITRDSCGFYYVTAWSNNRLNRFNPSLTGTHTVLPQVLSNPADIDCRFGSVDDLVGITNNNNTVSFVTATKPDAAITVNNFVLTTTLTYQSYQWYFNNAPISGAESQMYTATQNGDYYCRVGSGTCVDDSNVINVNTLGLTPFEDNQTIAVYPIPATDVLNIKMNDTFSTHDSINFNITNIKGQVVLRKQIINEATNNGFVTININDLTAGVYILSFDNYSQKVKFIKK
jgi:hypothetical protein